MQLARQLLVIFLSNYLVPVNILYPKQIKGATSTHDREDKSQSESIPHITQSIIIINVQPNSSASLSFFIFRYYLNDNHHPNPFLNQCILSPNKPPKLSKYSP